MGQIVSEDEALGINIVPGMDQDEIGEVLNTDPKQWSDSVNEKIGDYSERVLGNPPPSATVPPAAASTTSIAATTDQNDPSDLQGRERDPTATITPEEMDFLWQAEQRANERNRANAMNEGVDPSGRQYIDQPDAGPVQNNIVSEEDAFGTGPESNIVSETEAFGDSGKSDTPATDSALAKFSKAEAALEQKYSPDWLKNFESATDELVKGIPGMAKSTAGAAYQGAKFAVGGPQEKAQVAIEVMKQAVPQGEQMAKDLQSPVGSHEWWRGALQAGMMATPALEFLKGAPSVTPEMEKPPIMPAPIPSRPGGTIAGDVSRALADRQFTLVDQPPPEKPQLQLTAGPSRDQVLQNRYAYELQQVKLANDPMARRYAYEESAMREQPPLGPEYEDLPKGGETDASKITSTESVPEHGVRPQVGEEAPLRQQGETAPPRAQPGPAGESVASTVQAEPDAPGSGISTERLQDTYGKDAVIINQGKSAKAWKAIGDADKRDPYEVLTQASRRGIVGREDTPLLRSEHQRLLERSRNAYGTPAYPQLAQYAADFANAVKTVAHGPAHDIFMQLQEADVPKYDSPADFDNILRERMQREANMKEKETFEKVTDEVKNGDAEAKNTAKDAKEKLKKIPGKSIKFEDAVNHVKQQIKELTEPCAT